jgi:tetratricopeptide (TPR) repeat protein
VGAGSRRSRRFFLVIALLGSAHGTMASAHPGAEHTLAALSQSIQERPNDQQLYLQRGSAYSNEGQLTAALADFRKAETLGDPVLVAFHQGVLHYRMKEFVAARRYFDTFLKRFPGHPPSLEYRARLLRDAGDHKAALADFNAYFSVQPQPNPGDYVSAADLLAGLEGAGTASAIEMLDRGMERLGVIAHLQQRAIDLELQRNNIAGAIDRLGALEPSMGESPDWKVRMGELLLLADRPDDARQYLDAASVQLLTLRRTTARGRVLEKLRGLQASMGERPNAD